MLRFGAAGKCTRAGSVPHASTGLSCTSPPPPCLRHQLGDGEIRRSRQNGSERAGRALLSAAFVLCGVTQAPRCAQCKWVRPRCRLCSLIPVPPPRTHLPLLVRLRCKTFSVGPRRRLLGISKIPSGPRSKCSAHASQLPALPAAVTLGGELRLCFGGRAGVLGRLKCWRCSEHSGEPLGTPVPYPNSPVLPRSMLRTPLHSWVWQHLGAGTPSQPVPSVWMFPAPVWIWPWYPNFSWAQLCRDEGTRTGCGFGLQARFPALYPLGRMLQLCHLLLPCDLSLRKCPPCSLMGLGTPCSMPPQG